MPSVAELSHVLGSLPSASGTLLYVAELSSRLDVSRCVPGVKVPEPVKEYLYTLSVSLDIPAGGGSSFPKKLYSQQK